MELTRLTSILIALVAILMNAVCCHSAINFSPLNDIPVAYQGRFRPMETYTRQWLDEHAMVEPPDSNGALSFLFNLDILGHSSFDDTPLFILKDASLKSLLDLPDTESLFSYNTLHHALYDKEASNIRMLAALIAYHYDEAQKNVKTPKRKTELKALSPGLWVTKEQNTLKIVAAPRGDLWKFVRKGTTIPASFPTDTELAKSVMRLITTLKTYSQFDGQNASSLLPALPSKKDPATWVPLKMLNAKTSNFTAYNDIAFTKIQNAYTKLEKAVTTHTDNKDASILAEALMDGYRDIEGQPYRSSAGKTLSFPTISTLKMENLYYRFPFTILAIIGYSLAFITLILRKPLSWAIPPLCVAFIIQTACLVFRCLILARPPVSNMYETLLFVPWIAVLTAGILFSFYRSRFLLAGSALCATILLSLMEWGHINDSLDNVQPVLDSQYWLIIHVLMVVGSYGVFILGGVIGHFYLIADMSRSVSKQRLDILGKLILQTMYIGTALLIPGTILGGVWAAESWGRFWDWDPKESWAFISSCTYLIFIHAFTFKKIHYTGLAIGSIAGLMVISFTWYGVNYILGTGLHSYGFGSGGVGYFTLYIFLEGFFLAIYAGNNYYKRPSGKNL